MRVAAMHYHIDPVESAFEEVPIGLELERVRDHARGVREHAILGDNGIPFDATRTGMEIIFQRGSSSPRTGLNLRRARTRPVAGEDAR
jgi:hypothetical protein